jgi:putative nucleotidyltransferase with HDIG domain
MNDYIIQRVGAIKFLPTFPAIVGEVMSVIDDPNSSVSDLVKKMDPSLVGEVLKVANSAYFGRNSFRRISTVEQAVATIGYESLSDIVLQMPFISMLKTEDDLFNRKGFVRHALSTATIARTIGLVYAMGNANSAYVSGLLHDIGVIVIFEFFTEEWKEILDLIKCEHISRLDAENRVLNTTHAHIGAHLLEKWDLPETIISSVRLHHEHMPVEENENAYVAWLSDYASNEIDYEHDLTNFQSFFGRQRDLLMAEMPERLLLTHHVELFEKAFDQIKGNETLFHETSEELDD